MTSFNFRVGAQPENKTTALQNKPLHRKIKAFLLQEQESTRLRVRLF